MQTKEKYVKAVLTGLLFLTALSFTSTTAFAQQGPPSVNMSWNAVTVPTPAALTYKVERADALAGPYVQIGSPVAVTNLTDTTVVRGHTYFYRLKSSCPATGAGCGTASAPITLDSVPTASLTVVIPNTATTPPTPTNFTIDSVI